MRDLADIRDEIDQVDTQIIRLIKQRKRLVGEVTAYKKLARMQAYQPARFERVLERCRELAAAEDVDPDVIEALWHILHDYSLKLEKEDLDN